VRGALARRAAEQRRVEAEQSECEALSRLRGVVAESEQREASLEERAAAAELDAAGLAQRAAGLEAALGEAAENLQAGRAAGCPRNKTDRHMHKPAAVAAVAPTRISAP
jgi:hypothetical protein